ncbi:hypothetical protein GCM10023190_12520 [Enteractinococcus fodinae]
MVRAVGVPGISTVDTRVPPKVRNEPAAMASSTSQVKITAKGRLAELSPNRYKSFAIFTLAYCSYPDTSGAPLLQYRTQAPSDNFYDDQRI